MLRKTKLALLALEPGPASPGERQWTVKFQLAWGDSQHTLSLVVRAPDPEAAETQAREDLADDMIELAGWAVRRSPATLPRPAPAKFIFRRPEPAASLVPA